MTKICKFCGQEFTPTSNRQQYCKRPHIRKCPVCGKDYIEDNVENLKRPPVACSYECRVAKTQKTSLQKYGCKAPGNNPEARKKAKQTCIEHHGVEYAMQNEEVRSKAVATNLERYGVENAASSPEIIEKRMETSRTRYGDVMPFNSPEACAKQRKTLMERYGVTNALLIPEVQESLRPGHISKLNQSIAEKLSALGVRTELEKRLGTKYFDIFLPDSDTLLEVDPTYTHNSVGVGKIGPIDKYYHRDKTKLAESAGYRCVHIFDWDNVDLIVKSLGPKMQLDCADMKVYRLSTSATMKFLKENSIDSVHSGFVMSIGLVKDDEIYQVMTFGKPTHSHKHYVQIYSMCTRIGYEIVGGYDCLSKYASCLGLYNIIAYCDIAKHIESEFTSLGMKLSHVSEPRMYWSKGKKFLSSRVVQLGRAPYKSEQELLEHGWLPVYDCGQLVFEWSPNS